MNIEDIKTWKGAVEFTVYKYSRISRRRALEGDCGFCEITDKRNERCLDCPVHPTPNWGCDRFWNYYLSRPRVYKIFTAILAKVSIFSARNIRAALIKELSAKEREIFIEE